MNKKNIMKVCLASSAISIFMSTLSHADTLGIVTASSLNVRQEPSTSSSVVDRAYYGEKVSILSKEGNWFKIKLSESETAYVSANFIQQTAPLTNTVKAAPPTSITQIKALVNVPILNFRATPDTIDNNIIGKLKQDEKVNILSTQGEWSHIATSANEVGYVQSTFLQTSQVSTTKNLSASTEGVRTQIVAYAKQFLGRPYVFGGTSLTKGIDCSSFTQQMLRQFGYKVSRTSYTQIKDGTPVAYKDLLPGDLVFYGYSGVISHVALYIGEDKIIHASSPRTGVIISGLRTQGPKPLIGAVRIIE